MKSFSLCIHGRLINFDRPAIMAIVNATPDSFYPGSRAATAAEVARRTELMIAQGADIIDLGAVSTRPGATIPDETEEMRRLTDAIAAVRSVSADIPLSIDTFRASVARRCIQDLGADIINDISGGLADPMMDTIAAQTHAPYIIMHMRGTPQTMQSLTDYKAQGGVTAAVLQFFARRKAQLTDMGIADIILDPGFGFAKTLEQNWELMHALPIFRELDLPILVGISRKSMLTKPLDITPDQALPATIAANTLAIQGGASILRVHDPQAAHQTIRICQL